MNKFQSKMIKLLCTMSEAQQYHEFCNIHMQKTERSTLSKEQIQKIYTLWCNSQQYQHNIRGFIAFLEKSYGSPGRDELEGYQWTHNNGWMEFINYLETIKSIDNIKALEKNKVDLIDYIEHCMKIPAELIEDLKQKECPNGGAGASISDVLKRYPHFLDLYWSQEHKYHTSREDVLGKSMLPGESELIISLTNKNHDLEYQLGVYVQNLKILKHAQENLELAQHELSDERQEHQRTKENLEHTQQEHQSTKENLEHTQQEHQRTKENLEHTQQELSDERQEHQRAKENLEHTQQELSNERRTHQHVKERFNRVDNRPLTFIMFLFLLITCIPNIPMSWSMFQMFTCDIWNMTNSTNVIALEGNYISTHGIPNAS